MYWFFVTENTDKTDYFKTDKPVKHTSHFE